MDMLTAFGLFAVTAMLVCYAAEDRSSYFMSRMATGSSACRRRMAPVGALRSNRPAPDPVELTAPVTLPAGGGHPSHISMSQQPMAFATGTGAEVQRPLATVVIGGLISATLLTLAILPALNARYGQPSPRVTPAISPQPSP